MDLKKILEEVLEFSLSDGVESDDGRLLIMETIDVDKLINDYEVPEDSEWFIKQHRYGEDCFIFSDCFKQEIVRVMCNMDAVSDWAWEYGGDTISILFVVDKEE